MHKTFSGDQRHSNLDTPMNENLKKIFSGIGYFNKKCKYELKKFSLQQELRKVKY